MELGIRHSIGTNEDYDYFQFGAVASDNYKTSEFTFEVGMQLLGIEGIVEEYEDDMNTMDKLLALNFFKDACSRTIRPWLSRDLNEYIFDKDHHVNPINKKVHWIAEGVGAFVIIYVLMCTCILCWCSMINR